MPKRRSATRRRDSSGFGAFLLAMAAVVLTVAPARAQQRIDIPSRPGVTQPIYLTPARRPFASAILYPGGAGVVANLRGNFLVRSAGDFVDAGITVAVADTPSDLPGGMNQQFRSSVDQATDAAAIVAYLRGQNALPVWLIGTSNGTVSAANAALRLGPRVAGVVLTSAVWSGGLRDVAYDRLQVPVLVVHNRNDGCGLSPFDRAAPALNSMTLAPVRQLIAVESSTSFGSPCEAKSPHGYWHIEGQVVPAIAAWMKAH